MRCEVYSDAGRFLDLAGDFLTQREAEHTILLGAALVRREQSTAAQEGDGHPPEPRFFVVEDDTIRLAAALTSPFPLTLSLGEVRAFEPLVETLIEAGIRLPAVGGFGDMAEQFARHWQARRGCPARPGTELILYRFEEVIPHPGVPGALVAAEQGDLTWLVDWHQRFRVAIGHSLAPEAEMERRVAEKIARGQLYYWRLDGRPVSMVGILPTTVLKDAGRINAVFTPEVERGHGYASAAVAAVSQMVLEAGWRYCLISADAANPTTTKIYPEVGYQELNRYQEVRFDEGRT